MVFDILPTPGFRKNRIRRCVNSPLKKPVGKTRPAVLCLINYLVIWNVFVTGGAR